MAKLPKDDIEALVEYFMLLAEIESCQDTNTND